MISPSSPWAALPSAPPPVAPPVAPAAALAAPAAAPADPNRDCRRYTILAGAALLFPVALRIAPSAFWKVASVPIAMVASVGNLAYQTIGRVGSFALNNAGGALYRCGAGKDLSFSDVTTLTLISTFAIGLIGTAIKLCGKPKR